MIIPITNDKDIDTERDLSPAERHILQKLFGWKSMVDSLEIFRQRTREALQTGWNNSGPVTQSPVLKKVIQQLEKELLQRLDGS